MRRYFLIAQSSHFERKDFGCLLVSFNVLPLIEGRVSPELSKTKGVVLRISLVCIEEGICILPSCLTLVSLKIIPRYGNSYEK